jgi:hypothetical protein
MDQSHLERDHFSHESIPLSSSLSRMIFFGEAAALPDHAVEAARQMKREVRRRAPRTCWAACELIRSVCGAVMPRYYFNIRNGENFIPDDDGLELPNAATACAEAARTVAEMAKDVCPSESRRTISVEIRDDADRPVCMVALFLEIAKA